MPVTNLPFGSEFSPSQTDLPVLLEICNENQGNREAIEKAILAKYFAQKGGGDDRNKEKLAMNCRLGLKGYGIIDENCGLTDFGHMLYDLRANESEMYRVFAKHILLNLNGMGFIQCIKDMTLARNKITLETLRRACAERGIYFPAGGKHPSIMRLWLSKAGIFEEHGWQVDDEHLESVLGKPNSMESLRSLTLIQRDFLRALLNTGVSGYQKASDIVRLAEATFGSRFPEKSLPKVCLNALEEAGYINVQRTTKGRGAKSPLVSPTEKADREIVVPFLKQLAAQTDPKLTELLRKPLREILDEVKSSDRYISGLALEALAFRLMRILNMEYVATRLRAEKTGGAEVDLIFESDRPVFSRWQIQCKNTAHVSLEDVAKEVGLTHMLKSNVIVMVSTGKVSKPAYYYADSVMKSSNLCIVMLEISDIEAIADDATIIVDIFNRQAKATMKLKRLTEGELSNE